MVQHQQIWGAFGDFMDWGPVSHHDIGQVVIPIIPDFIYHCGQHLLDCPVISFNQTIGLGVKPDSAGLMDMQEFTKVGNKVWLEFLTLIRMQTPGDPKSTDKLFHQHISDCRSSVIF